MGEQLIHEIGALKRQVLALGALAEESVHRATVAMVQRNASLARSVIVDDLAIDMAEVDLEEECMRVLALHQPVAADLRFVVAVLRINANLERIGDLAVSIAERADHLATTDPVVFPIDFLGMARSVRHMLARSLDSLAGLNSVTARGVLDLDDEVDSMNRIMYREVQDRIRADPGQLDQLIHMLSATRNLERIADHCTNIAGDVIYIADGEVVRHKANAPVETTRLFTRKGWRRELRKAGKLRVLFLCTANSARSQMAEGIIRHLLGATWEPASAGTAPGGLNPLAVAAMREIGVDISGQRSKRLDDVDGDFDLAVTLCGSAAESCPFFPRAAETLHVGFDDPAAATGSDEERLAAFRRVRDQLKETLVPLLLSYGSR